MTDTNSDIDAASVVDVDGLEQELEARRWKMESMGLRRCDIAACNCGGWHGGHAMQRLTEISEAMPYANGPTILQRVESLVADNARLREAIEKAPCPDGSRHDPTVCPYDKCNCWKRQALEPTKGSDK